jgi:hypothetical protein
MDNPLQKFQNEVNEAIKIAPEGRLAEKNDNELRRATTVLRKFLSGQMYPPPLIQNSIEAIENELSRRQKDSHQEGVMGEMGKLKVEVGLLKNSIDQLSKPHWVLWATLVATAIAAIAGVVLLFR